MTMDGVLERKRKKKKLRYRESKGKHPQYRLWIDQKQLENFSYFGSNITHDERRTRKIKLRIVMGKTALHKKQTLFTNKPEFNLRKKLVKCYIWSAVVYGAGNGTLRKVDHKYSRSFEMWCGRRTEINWTNRVTGIS
jgi:hypothetical protein